MGARGAAREMAGESLHLKSTVRIQNDCLQNKAVVVHRAWGGTKAEWRNGKWWNGVIAKSFKQIETTQL